MMDIDTIKRLSREAGRNARRTGKVPFIATVNNIAAAKEGRLSQVSIPDLGTHVPKGWRRVNLENELPDTMGRGTYRGDNAGFGAYMVDNSGFGTSGEPAYTLQEFIGLLRPGYGYAVVETGPFQVKVGVFDKVLPPGVTVVDMENPAAMHKAIADAIGE